MRFVRHAFCALVFLTGCNAIFGLTAGEPGEPSGGSGGSVTAATAGSAAGSAGGGQGGGATGAGGAGGGSITFGPEEQVATNQPAPRGVAVDADHIYWVNFGDGTVKRRPKDLAGSSQEIANGQGQPSVIALHPSQNQVYWATYEPLVIRRCAPGGGGVIAVYEPNWLANAEGLVVTANHLFWTNDSTELGTPMWEMIGRVDNTSTMTYAPLAEGQDAPRGIAYHDGYVYWTASTEGAVRRISYSAAPGTSYEPIYAGGKVTTGVVADSTHVYWGEQNGLTVQRLAHADYQGTPEVIGPDEGEVAAMAIDDAYVYWCNLAGGVKAWPKGGTTALPIASDGSGNCRGLAVDNDGLYWVDTLGGRVLMARKP